MTLSDLVFDYLPITSRTGRQLFYGSLAGLALSTATTSLLQYYDDQYRRKAASSSLHHGLRPIELRSDEIVDGVIGLIGEYAFLLEIARAMTVFTQVIRRSSE